jgi:AcrR family transcriptional regulator
MPTPPKTSAAEIVHAARDLLVEGGMETLTMQAIALRVGVRGPSLYKHFSDRNDVLRAVEESVVTDLKNVLSVASRSRDDRSALRKMAAAYRRFAQESPAAYGLIFGLHTQDERAEAARRQALEPALQRLQNLIGDAGSSFVRARVLTAFLHGFVSMEAAGAFKMGGCVDDAFRAGIELLLATDKPHTSK